MQPAISIFWFRQDLRLMDNPGLIQAANFGKILPIYIFDDLSPAPCKIGSASKIYLHHALATLNQALDNQLNLYIGDPSAIILQLSKKYHIDHIFWNRCYEPWHLANDAMMVAKLRDWQINCTIDDGSYLWQPKAITKADGSYYKVFSAYKKKAYLLSPKDPQPKPKQLVWLKDHDNHTTLNDLNLLSDRAWQHKIQTHWTGGEHAAQAKLAEFLSHQLSGYKKNRDYPDYDQTSKLSMHLHFGEISPQQIFAAVNSIGRFNAAEDDVNHFINEMIWREFSGYLMVHFNQLQAVNFNSKFNHFPWKSDSLMLQAWQNGNTGYPLVDAGMRQLWQTGYMHNRLRMITASFLVKNLMIHWHYGRDWFWECLVDADLANNSASWQWVAGCGADAAPYFRIFNPIIQGEKFDHDGNYTRKFIPELKHLPNKYLFKPWEAPAAILKEAGVVLGVNYPKPIVDWQTSRKQALFAYKKLSTVVEK